MNYSVFWNGEEKAVSTANINEPCYNSITKQEFALFSVKGSGKLTIKSSTSIQSATIRPFSLGIKPTIIDEHTITAELCGAAKFSLEINGSHKQNLLIFASEYRQTPACPEGGKIIRFAPGVHTVGRYTVTESNTLIIVEEGAVINGGISIENAENVTVCGHGIITKQIYPYGSPCKGGLMSLQKCRNVNIYDVSLIDSIAWTCVLSNCDNVHIDNINITGSRGNTDGIDVCGSRNVLVERVFTRTWDDSFVVKAFDTGNVENIEFRNSTLWNDFARPMEIGVELRADRVNNIKFSNIDVIHSMTGYPMMGIHHGDHAVVSNVTMDDIRLEDINGGQIFDIRITDSVWNCDTKKGRIENVNIKNIAVMEEQNTIPSRSRISGFSSDADIKNVTLENFSFCGRYASDIKDCQVEIYDHVENIVYNDNAPKCAPRLNRISSSIEFISEPFSSDGTNYSATVRLGLKNEGKTHESGHFRLHVSPLNSADYDADEQYFSLQPGAVCYRDYDVKLMAGKYVIDVQSSNPCIEYVYKYIALDAHISDNIEKAVPFVFSNYYGEITSGFLMAASDSQLIVKSPRDDVDIILYTALPVKPVEDEVLFTVEETDFGIAPAITLCKEKPVLAPQLRCPAEITYVFENQPKVEVINSLRIKSPKGIQSIPFSELGLPVGCRNFLFEAVLCTKESESRRYPYSLFHSVVPGEIAHMFCNVIVDK